MREQGREAGVDGSVILIEAVQPAFEICRVVAQVAAWEEIFPVGLLAVQTDQSLEHQPPEWPPVCLQTGKLAHNATLTVPVGQLIKRVQLQRQAVNPRGVPVILRTILLVGRLQVDVRRHEEQSIEWRARPLYDVIALGLPVHHACREIQVVPHPVVQVDAEVLACVARYFPQNSSFARVAEGGHEVGLLRVLGYRNVIVERGVRGEEIALRVADVAVKLL